MMNQAVADDEETRKFQDISDEESCLSSYTSQYAVLFRLLLCSIVKTATAHLTLYDVQSNAKVTYTTQN